MSRVTYVRPQFVDIIPSDITDGVIYVSIKYRTAAHNCCCGCGHKVVTPISPTDWQLIYNGVDISLSPSIGNWSFECLSHYWIKAGQIRWSYRLTPDEIRRSRDRDHQASQIAAGEILDKGETTDQSGRANRKHRWFRRG